VNIDTMRFSHILEANGLYDLNYFFSRTAFVIAHKSESLETLLGVIWYLPVNSPILIVTNCSQTEEEALRQGLLRNLAGHREVYLIHQKDEAIARFFLRYGVHTILGADGKVVNGKGEGMYIGALMASLLGYPEWIVFYDADNFVPNALMEYTLAMSKLFLQERQERAQSDTMLPYLHNVRICWSSKPAIGSNSITPGILGRCTRVVSPLMTTLAAEWLGTDDNSTIITSNAGEQGFTMRTAQTLRFSSGYSVETFQLLDLFAHTLTAQQPGHVLLQQYQAQSPHFHEKRDDQHIQRMIADSLGGFLHFKGLLPPAVERQLERICNELQLEITPPVLYPALFDLPLERNDILFAEHYHLFAQGTGLTEQEALCG
jgi:mannosyl-3-phosphoglycerate synthase